MGKINIAQQSDDKRLTDGQSILVSISLCCTRTLSTGFRETDGQNKYCMVI
jgi:hypothetical protein